jgi:hypothetical protein
VRELATIGELEERIRKLEEVIFTHDKAIKRLFDVVRRVNDTQFKQPNEDQERSKKESSERMNRIMKELGYETD